MEKRYDVPPIAWLKVTDYMHDWLQYELGGGARIKDQRVVCVQDIPGARDILKMEAKEDLMDKEPVGNGMSATRRNCYMAGLDLDEEVMEKEYGVTRELMKLFVPIECPKRCLTKYGVLRRWTFDYGFSKEQASAMQRLLRKEFWEAVEEYDRKYARKMDGEKYPAIDMIEAFCAETKTSEVYVDAIRREWQRRVKREKERSLDRSAR